MKVRSLAAALVAATTLAVPAHHLVAQGTQPPAQDTARHPRNVKEAASNTGHEAKRVFKRSEKTVVKAGDDTKKQAERTVNSVKRRLHRKHRKHTPADTTAR